MRHPIRPALVLLLLVPGACLGPIPPLHVELLDGMSKSRDITRRLAAESLDDAIGGNAVLGQGGPVARRGGFTVAVRATRADRGTPTLAGTAISEAGSQPGAIAVTSGASTTVGADISYTVLSGFVAGGTRILSLEALASLSSLSTPGGGGLNLTRTSRISFGFGMRLGVVAEAGAIPGVSLSVRRHHLPSFRYQVEPVATDGGGSIRVGMHDFSGEVSSVRLAAEKHFGRFGVAAGWGQDNLTANATIDAAIDGGTGVSDSQGDHFTGRRRVLFAGGSYRLSQGLSLAAEVVRASHTLPPSVNTVGEGATWSKTMLSVGIRVGTVR